MARKDFLRFLYVFFAVYVLFSIADSFLPVFAELEKVGFENKHTVRITARSDDDDYDLYLTRAQVNIDYKLPQFERTIKVLPFFEYQSNFDTDTWWRKELGVELGSSFFNEIFYYGASFQYIWQKQENYPIEDLTDTVEWESRFVITPHLPWEIFAERLKLHLVDEYTYDFTRGQGTINDVAVILDRRVHKNIIIPIGFRHVDRIHDFDSDIIELSILFSF